MQLHLETIARHRNGICGAPFHVVLFRDRSTKCSRHVAIIFDEPHHVAILDMAKLDRGDIAFGSNSWRGDHYEPQLRQLIEQMTQEGQS